MPSHVIKWNESFERGTESSAEAVRKIAKKYICMQKKYLADLNRNLWYDRNDEITVTHLHTVKWFRGIWNMLKLYWLQTKANAAGSAPLNGDNFDQQQLFVGREMRKERFLFKLIIIYSICRSLFLPSNDGNKRIAYHFKVILGSLRYK